MAGRFDNSMGLLKLTPNSIRRRPNIPFLEAEVSLQRATRRPPSRATAMRWPRTRPIVPARRRLAALGAAPPLGRAPRSAFPAARRTAGVRTVGASRREQESLDIRGRQRAVRLRLRVAARQPGRARPRAMRRRPPSAAARAWTTPPDRRPAPPTDPPPPAGPPEPVRRAAAGAASPQVRAIMRSITAGVWGASGRGRPAPRCAPRGRPTAARPPPGWPASAPPRAD